MTHPLFWIGLALGVALAGLGLALLSRRWRRAEATSPVADDDDSPLPRTLVQQRAYWGLVIGTLAAIGAAVVVALGDPATFQENESMRAAVYAIFGGGAVAYAVVCFATRRAHGGEVLLDERDREILARAPRVQAAAILATLLVWTIALTELYWDRGAVPIAFPFLVFLTSCVVGLLAFSAGVVLGYRRA